jgi:hypothetical protein
VFAISLFGVDMWLVAVAGIGLLIMIVSKAPAKKSLGGYKKRYSGKRYNGGYHNRRYRRKW